MFNGNLTCISDEPLDLIQLIRDNKGNTLPADIGIVNDVHVNEIRFYSESGRMCRPLFIVEQQHLVLTSSALYKLKSVCFNKLFNYIVYVLFILNYYNRKLDKMKNIIYGRN